jgi:hypothetical protein
MWKGRYEFLFTRTLNALGCRVGMKRRETYAVKLLRTSYIKKVESSFA